MGHAFGTATRGAGSERRAVDLVGSGVAVTMDEGAPERAICRRDVVVLGRTKARHFRVC